MVVDLGYRIFISSTMDDLEEERHKIAIEVMRSENVPVMAEYMINVLDRPRGALEKKVDGCDGYIGVFHKRWGYVPEKDNPDKLSISAIEYERAKKRNLPCLILISNYEKDDELKRFIEKISDLDEGNWRIKYVNSQDLIIQVIRGLPNLVNGIRFRQSETQPSRRPALEIFPSISGPIEVTEYNIIDVSEEIINSYANIITTSPKADVKHVAWRYLGKLAENRRIWKYAKMWSLLDSEILVYTPTVFFFNASSIIEWMLKNSENDLRRRDTPTRNIVRQHYLAKFKEILGSINVAWDSYHRVEVKQILKDITEKDERCEIWWDAWKKCAKGIEDTNQYTHLTQFLSTELENSDSGCKDSIRMEQLSIIENGEPTYFAQRAKELQI
jgi:hypothetical protein